MARPRLYAPPRRVAPFAVYSAIPPLGVQRSLFRCGLFTNNNVSQGIDSYIAQMGSQLGMNQADMTLIGTHDITAAARCLYEGIAGRGTYSAPTGVLVNDIMTEYRTDALDSNGAQTFGVGRIWFQCEVTATPGIVPTGIYFGSMNAAGVNQLNWLIQNDGSFAPGVDNAKRIGISGGPRPSQINGLIFRVEADRGLIYSNQTNQAAAAAGTLGNAPVAGNPAIWVPIIVNGVNRSFPAW